jgi:hypothetical protein
MMIKIREKDLLFCVVNIIGFLGFCAWFLMDYMMVIGIGGLENIQGFTEITMAAILIRGAAALFMILLWWVVCMVDIWWLYRIVSKWYWNSYRRDNL